MEKSPFGQTFLGVILAGVIVGILMLYLSHVLNPGTTGPQTSAPQPSTETATPDLPTNASVTKRKKTSPKPAALPDSEPQAETPPPAQDIAPPKPVEPVRVPKGRFEYNRQVVVLGSGFYGYKLPLTLEAVENDPTNRLSLHFLVENQDNEKYTLSLSHPHDTAIAVDDAHTEHSFLSSENIDDLSGLTIPALSRQRFVVSFQPLTVARNNLRAQLVLELKYGNSSSGGARSIEIPDIPIDHLNQ
jgi:hypothetical protein